MAQLIIHQKVQEYSTFRRVYDEQAANRSAAGCTDAQVFQSASDPNEIAFITNWPSVEAMKAFATSPSHREAMKRAAATSQPEILFLVEA